MHRNINHPSIYEEEAYTHHSFFIKNKKVSYDQQSQTELNNPKPLKHDQDYMLLYFKLHTVSPSFCRTQFSHSNREILQDFICQISSLWGCLSLNPPIVIH